ncbi:PEP-CTERM sorting domain-containing protein [Parasphingopyxis sp.]|uniref:PEP-CTERM sorting domain-containing protein n=1 Tax=Parasphingopyxis sp. TaxID=1920299 RepID=UPI00260B989E|nr:PEP-CTERM sorting domain-containing protein [Parasphingopyxis sp.]
MMYQPLRSKALMAAALASAAFFVQPAQAEIITYDIYNSAGPDGTGLVAGGGVLPRPYWSFQPGSTFSVDYGTGRGSLSATLINSLGVLTPLELELSGLLDTLDGTNFYYVQGSGGPYNPATQDYFTNASGTFDYQPFGEPIRLNPDDPITGNSVFQFGEGANYTDPEKFGFAAWLQFIHPETGNPVNWDIYGDLHHRPTDVPEPAPMALFGLSIAGLAFARSRRRKKSQTRFD